jgi:hypothetical protein
MPRTNHSPEKQLASFLAKYDPETASLAEAVLVEMRARYPTALELVYDNYNALAIGFGPTERPSQAIFSIALFPRWVSLFLLQAKGVPDPEKRLQGSGSVAKRIVLPSPAALNDPAVRSLLKEAVARAVVPFDSRGTRRLIIKSISAKQRPRRPTKGASKTSPSQEPSRTRKSPSGKRSNV